MHQKELFHTSSLQRERHAVIDATVERTLDALAIPVVAQALGERAVQIENVLHSAIVPNIHHGRILSADVPGDRVAFIAAYRDEDLHIVSSDLRINDYQRDALYGGFHAESVDEMVDFYTDCHRTESSRKLQIALPSHSVALVASFMTPLYLEDGGHIGLRSAPNVLLDAGQDAHRMPEVVSHEAYHVHQQHEYPIEGSWEHPLHAHEEDEHEAYSVESDMITVFRRLGRYGFTQAGGSNDLLTMAEYVDTLRRRVQGKSKQPFKASRRLRRLLRQDGIEL